MAGEAPLDGKGQGSYLRGARAQRRGGGACGGGRRQRVRRAPFRELGSISFRRLSGAMAGEAPLDGKGQGPYWRGARTQRRGGGACGGGGRQRVRRAPFRELVSFRRLKKDNGDENLKKKLVTVSHCRQSAPPCASPSLSPWASRATSARLCRHRLSRATRCAVRAMRLLARPRPRAASGAPAHPHAPAPSATECLPDTARRCVFVAVAIFAARAARRAPRRCALPLAR